MFESHYFWVFMSGIIVNHCIKTNVLAFIIIIIITLYLISHDEKKSFQSDHVSTMTTNVEVHETKSIDENEKKETGAIHENKKDNEEDTQYQRWVDKKRQSSEERRRLYASQYNDTIHRGEKSLPF